MCVKNLRLKDCKMKKKKNPKDCVVTGAFEKSVCGLLFHWGKAKVFFFFFFLVKKKEFFYDFN